MKIIFLVIATIFLAQQSLAQKITYSEFEKKDFDRFTFDVVGKFSDSILVYKGVYFASPFVSQNQNRPRLQFANPDPQGNTPGMVSTPDNSILESTICIYNQQMQLLQQVKLHLPDQISGVCFLIYDHFFYIFYQYQQAHTVFCMAAKIGSDGKMIGSPILMDKTDIMDIHYQSQIYSVIFNENKNNIAVIKIRIDHEKGYILSSILFDRELHLLRRSETAVPSAGATYLQDFRLDNNATLAFIGGSELSDKNEPSDILYLQRSGSDKLLSYLIVPAKLYADDIRLTIDNRNKRYLITSFFSNVYQGDIKGFYANIWDPASGKSSAQTTTLFGDSLRKQISRVKANAFDNYFLQDIRLRSDGGFVTEAMELSIFPQRLLIDRWNYFQYLPPLVAGVFYFYDPHEFDHYYPWKAWHFLGNNFSYSSENTFIMLFSNTGNLESINAMNTTQDDRFYGAIGLTTAIAKDLIYFVYNELIHGRTYLIAQSLNGKGQMNSDDRLKEDLELPGVNKDLTHYPRFARAISDSEIIFPCRRGRGYICLAKIEF
jgi:hypothetical protein